MQLMNNSTSNSRAIIMLVNTIVSSLYEPLNHITTRGYPKIIGYSCTYVRANTQFMLERLVIHCPDVLLETCQDEMCCPVTAIVTSN